MGVSSSLWPVSGEAPAVTGLLREWLRADSAEPLVIETSGSTGAPKRVQLSREALTASAHATHARIGGPGQWLLNLPATYVAGVQVIVRSLLAGHDPVVQDGSLAEALGRMDGPRRYLSLVPTQLHRALEDPAEVTALAGFDTVLLGGSAIDPVLRSRAEAVGIRIVATYGMSETCGGCVYDGRPLDGVRLMIGDDDRIRISGPMRFDCYPGQPELTDEVCEGEWLVTSDLGRLDDGVLTVLGRADDVVISGGVNVPAEAVARRLRAHPCVEGAEVLGVADDEWGQRIVAFVVGQVTLSEAREWVAAEHPRAWAPRELREVPTIPLLDNGKVDRLKLLGVVAAGE